MDWKAEKAAYLADLHKMLENAYDERRIGKTEAKGMITWSFSIPAPSDVAGQSDDPFEELRALAVERVV